VNVAFNFCYCFITQTNHISKLNIAIKHISNMCYKYVEKYSPMTSMSTLKRVIILQWTW